VKRKLITENDIVALVRKGVNTLHVEKNAIITPAARDKINDLKITVIVDEKGTPREVSKHSIDNGMKSLGRRIALASDHTGFAIKEEMKSFLKELEYEIVDLGTHSPDSCDYPDFAFAAAKKVALRETDFAIIFDATGIPSAITANKVPGIRAATCYNEFSAKSSREHNDANVLALGAKTLGTETIKSIIKVWLASEFLGERHQRRLDKITDIEKHFLGGKI
jgi:ribose 5-phosphate isomerase B